ncbi:MAG: hypothetical protein AAGF45_12060 [Pseudomonadota bacterium]
MMKFSYRFNKGTKHSAQVADVAARSSALLRRDSGSETIKSTRKETPQRSGKGDQAAIDRTRSAVRGDGEAAPASQKKADRTGSLKAENAVWRDEKLADVGKLRGGKSPPAKADLVSSVQRPAKTAPASAELAYTIAKTREFVNGTRVTRGRAPAPISEVFAGFEGNDYRDIASPLLDAISAAVAGWVQEAYFDDIVIYGPTATGGPGCLNGPALDPAIRAALPATLTGHKEEMAKGVAEAFSDCFALWQSHVIVPGLPWYPAFAAWPGDEADPMPNIPVSLAALPSQYVTKAVLKFELESAISSALPAPMREERVFIGSLAGSLSRAFATWLNNAMVSQVIGMGPVPAFAPPAVPVHLVMGGWVIPEPPHMSVTAPFRAVWISF